MVPRSAQGDSGPQSFALFSTFGALGAPRKRQKEPQGAQTWPKWYPKLSRRVPKASSKGYFFGIGETLIFDDSIMIFMVFWCPEGPLEVQKSKKKQVKGEMENKNDKISSKITIWSGMQIPWSFWLALSRARNPSNPGQWRRLAYFPGP